MNQIIDKARQDSPTLHVPSRMRAVEDEYLTFLASVDEATSEGVGFFDNPPDANDFQKANTRLHTNGHIDGALQFHLKNAMGQLDLLARELKLSETLPGA